MYHNVLYVHILKYKSGSIMSIILPDPCQQSPPVANRWNSWQQPGNRFLSRQFQCSPACRSICPVLTSENFLLDYISSSMHGTSYTENYHNVAFTYSSASKLNNKTDFKPLFFFFFFWLCVIIWAFSPQPEQCFSLCCLS